MSLLFSSGTRPPSVQVWPPSVVNEKLLVFLEENRSMFPTTMFFGSLGFTATVVSRWGTLFTFRSIFGPNVTGTGVFPPADEVPGRSMASRSTAEDETTATRRAYPLMRPPHQGEGLNVNALSSGTLKTVICQPFDGRCGRRGLGPRAHR